MDINSLPVVCGGLEVIEYETIVESCVVGTVENDKWRIRHYTLQTLAVPLLYVTLHNTVTSVHTITLTFF